MTNGATHAVPVISWWAGGLGIGLILILAVALVQPIGVSTQYVVLDGVLLHRILPEVAAQSPYLVDTAAGWTLLNRVLFCDRYPDRRLSRFVGNQAIQHEARSA